MKIIKEIKIESNPIITGYLFKLSKELTGLARFQSNFLRFSSLSDSGNIKYPYNQLSKVSPAETKNGTRAP